MMKNSWALVSAIRLSRAFINFKTANATATTSPYNAANLSTAINIPPAESINQGHTVSGGAVIGHPFQPADSRIIEMNSLYPVDFLDQEHQVAPPSNPRYPQQSDSTLLGYCWGNDSASFSAHPTTGTYMQAGYNASYGNTYTQSYAEPYENNAFGGAVGALGPVAPQPKAVGMSHLEIIRAQGNAPRIRGNPKNASPDESHDDGNGSKPKRQKKSHPTGGIDKGNPLQQTIQGPTQPKKRQPIAKPRVKGAASNARVKPAAKSRAATDTDVSGLPNVAYNPTSEIFFGRPNQKPWDDIVEFVSSEPSNTEEIQEKS